MKDYKIENYQPQAILKQFAKICKIPHTSFHEKQLSDFLCKFFQENDCIVKQNKIGNLVVTKKATKGFEKYPYILLQGHLDMVASTAPNSNIDMLKQPVIPYVEDGWLKAENTSLGIDDGWAIAIIMEIFSNDKIQHGPLEAIFTVQEEESTIGADSVEKGAYKSKYYINLDGGDQRMVIGSAGGSSFSAIKKIKLVGLAKDLKPYLIKIQDLDGGHSGTSIHIKHINAIKFIGESLFEFSLNNDLFLVNIDGGNAQGSIPTYCEATILINPKDLKKLKDITDKLLKSYKQIIEQDKNAKVIIKLTQVKNKKMMTKKDSIDLLNLIVSTIDGTLFADNANHGYMYVSSNMGLIKMSKNEIKITNMARSFDDNFTSKIKNINQMLCKQFDFKKIIENPEDTWGCWVTSIENNKVAKLYLKSYKDANKEEASLYKTPGGLEIVDIITKNPITKNNSIGIGVKNHQYHSYNERCELISIQKTFNALLKLLKNANQLEN